MMEVEREGSYLIMSEDEINALIERCQQPEVIQRRDAFFAELDQMGITRNPDGSMEVEFTPKPPDSAIPFCVKPPKEETTNFCADCLWYETAEMYCLRQGNHSHDACNCVLWEPKAEPPKEEA